MTFLSDILWISRENFFNPEGFLVVLRVKSSIFMIFIEKVKFSCSSHPKFSRARLALEDFGESRPRFTSGSWKNRKMKPSQLFTTCARFLAPEMTHFQLFRPEWKLLTFLKQKM